MSLCSPICTACYQRPSAPRSVPPVTSVPLLPDLYRLLPVSVCSPVRPQEATLRLQQQQARVETRESALDKERASLLDRVEKERHQIEVSNQLSVQNTPALGGGCNLLSG